MWGCVIGRIYSWLILLSSSNRKYQPFPLLSYFPSLCAWGGCTHICCRFHLYPRKAGFCFFYYCAVLRCVQIIGYIMARWSYSFVCTLHHPIIIIMQTYLIRYWTSSMLVRFILWSVCLRLSQFSQLSSMPYMGLCVFNLPISLTVTVRIGVLYRTIIIKSEVWPIYHCLWLGHETMRFAVCLSTFLWMSNYTTIRLLVFMIIYWCPSFR